MSSPARAPSPVKRFACDRCHGQKLRCPRVSGAGPCTRCEKVGVRCVVSAAHRTGRPAKSSQVQVEQNPTQARNPPSTRRVTPTSLGERSFPEGTDTGAIASARYGPKAPSSRMPTFSSDSGSYGESTDTAPMDTCDAYSSMASPARMRSCSFDGLGMPLTMESYLDYVDWNLGLINPESLENVDFSDGT